MACFGQSLYSNPVGGMSFQSTTASEIPGQHVTSKILPNDLPFAVVLFSLAQCTLRGQGHTYTNQQLSLILATITLTVHMYGLMHVCHDKAIGTWQFLLYVAIKPWRYDAVLPLQCSCNMRAGGQRCSDAAECHLQMDSRCSSMQENADSELTSRAAAGSSCEQSPKVSMTVSKLCAGKV